MTKPIDLSSLGIKSVTSEKAPVPVEVKKQTLYERLSQISKNAINFILGLLEFLILAFIMSMIIYYGWSILICKNHIRYSEAVKAIDKINENWKAALVIIGFILSRIILKKIYDLKVISKDKAEFEAGGKK